MEEVQGTEVVVDALEKFRAICLHICDRVSLCDM